MDFVENFQRQLFSINEDSFEDSSLAVFDFQYRTCEPYHQYCKSLGKNPTNVRSTHEIPFLPIDFFKQFEIKSGDWKTEKVYKSSGTTSTQRSTHHIADVSFYHTVCKKIFEQFFDALHEFQLLALLPSYQEQGDSSLISMVDSFITQTSEGSGYYLQKNINNMLTSDAKKILIGVSYALLDLPRSSSCNTTIIETGGMKGRRKEMIREELHEQIQKNLNPISIWSEYGMTELQSQAYGRNGEFQFPTWAKTLIREVNDPFTYLDGSKTGGINIIDLANVQSCAFIETKDLGRVKNGFFEVLGRFDNSDIRGCNLLV